MKYYKKIEGGIITQFGICASVHYSQIEISIAEYNTLLKVHSEKPIDTLEYIYRLDESGTYVGYSRTYDETVTWYIECVNNGEMTIAEVPDAYRSDVETKVTPQQSEEYTAGYDQAVLDMLESGVL